MSTRERCHMLLDRLDESGLQAAMTLLEKIDEELDMEFCVSLYDEAKASDDGYRISADELKVKYGI